ncbi:MAG: D-glycerate dehydrogenase [bacterium]
MDIIFVTRPLPGKAIDELKKLKGFTVKVHPKEALIARKQLLKEAKGAVAVIPELTEKIDAEFLRAAGPQLKVVANYAVGFDNIDLKACKAAGVRVSNAPSQSVSDAVAEHTVTLIFALAKRIVEADKFTRAGKYKGWEPHLLMDIEIQNKVLGIIGLGRIGIGVATRCKAMGMKIVYNDVKPNPDFERELGAIFMDRNNLLKHADAISLHVPLLPQTRHLIGARELKMMKKSAFLVNTSRGPVIDEKALAAALKARTIRGAGLDVFEFEPKITQALMKLDNVILTPHTASATFEARSAMATIAAQNVIAALTGKPMPTEIKF